MRLAVDARNPAAVGRQAVLDLAFERRSGRTCLTQAYAEPPLRVGRVFEIDDAAYLVLVCTGPGVFGGDRLQCRIAVGPGARVVIVSQSSLQVHPAERPEPARVEQICDVADEGELLCHWDPVIPFASSRLVQRIELRLAPHARLYWGDGLMAGRVSRGESWQFAGLDHELKVRVGDAMPYLERYRLSPGERPPTGRWAAARATYLGTTIVRHEAATSESVEALHRELDTPGCSAAVDLVDASRHVMVGRFLSANGPAWHDARGRCRDLAFAGFFGRSAACFRR